MKIDCDKLGVQPGPVDRLTRPGDARTTGGSAPTHGGGDHLQLSPDAQTVRAGVEAAATQPDIRADLVDRMRELLNEGGLGADKSRLANAIIDGWLNTR
jgi:Anti-sigma-28 factor, FlgM